MSNDVLNVLLVDEGMNTGVSEASKIGGGQIAIRRFFSNTVLFKITILTSETEIVRFWEGLATIIYEPGMQTYRPTRIHIAKSKIKWLSLLKDGFQAARILNRYLETAAVDVVFLNDNKSRMIYILSRLTRWKAKHHACAVIQVDGEWKLGAFDFFMKFFYMLAFDRIMCPTNAIQRTLGVLGRLVKKKYYNAYPGVVLPDESEVQIQKKIQNENIIFGCIGTLRTAVKGQDILVRAVRRLVEENGHIPFKVHFYGDGPDKRLLEKMIKKIDVNKYFEFKGYVSDQKQIYSKIDACILASRTEVAPLVLMECLVRNIPVIAADLDGVKEITSNFYEELLFEQGNDEALASILTRVLKSNILDRIREQLRNADKRIITRDYQVKRVYKFLRA